MKTTDGHPAENGKYYYIENGQEVMLEECATKDNGETVYLVIPHYEGETLIASGAGGSHHEISGKYYHDGFPMMAKSLFIKPPLAILHPEYKAKLDRIEELAAATGKLALLNAELESNKRRLTKENNELVPQNERLKKTKEETKKELAAINENINEARANLSSLEDSISNVSESVPDEHIEMISVEELKKLRRAQYMLQCLENAGVDNWDGRDYAIDEYRKRYPED